MDEIINIQEFIAEIELYPAIWDTACEDYKNKLIKKHSWEQIILKFCPEFVEKTSAEKYNIAQQLQRKWKSLRDCYTRELSRKRKEKKSGKGASGRKQYIYFKHLNFLKATRKERTSNIKEEPDDSQEEGVLYDTDESEESPISLTPPKRVRFTSCVRKEPEDNLLQALANTVMKDKPETCVERDEDTLFMLSLVSELKKIPDDLKLDAKSEIISVLRKFRKTKSSTSRTAVEHLTDSGTHQPSSSSSVRVSRSSASSQDPLSFIDSE